MRKTFFALMGAAALASCGGSGVNYNIQGTIDPSMNGKMVYVYDMNSTARMGTAIDSVLVEEGKFTFNGNIASPTMFLVGAAPYFMQVVAESNPLTVELSQQSKITGGELNAKLAEHMAANVEATNVVRNVYADPNATPEQKDAAYEAYMASGRERAEALLVANTDNMLGVYAIQTLIQGKKTVAEFDEVINRAALAKDYAPFQAQREVLVNAENTANGKMFVDFKAKTQDGKEVSLSDYVGKGNYVLVDFWASWCGPCKGEIPNLRAAHEKYKDKGFIMLGVNVWDNKEGFEKSIVEENMTWENIYASDNKDATTLYGISGIPTIILFGPDGTIIDRVRGEAIEKALSEAYK